MVIMNEDQVIGAVVNFVGKLQKDLGKMLGSKNQLNKGIRKQIIGEAQQNYGKAVEAVKSARRHNHQ